MTIDLDALEALAKAATPGPWEDDMLYNVRESNDSKCVVVVTKTCTERFPTPNDAAYIAAANPAVVLELVAETRRQRKAMQRLARALRVKNSALAFALRVCKFAQDRAAEAEKEAKK